MEMYPRIEKINQRSREGFSLTSGRVVETMVRDLGLRHLNLQC